jgi:2'-5' RNA ligase
MKQKTVRLFFALWPGEDVRDQLLKASGSVQLSKRGRCMRKENLHMTLHFIGNTDVNNSSCLQEVAEKVVSQPFTLQLDQVGQFKRAGIVWLGCSSTPSGLYKLHHQLGQIISTCNFQPEKRHYRPHVTLYRKAILAETVPEVSAIHWQVNGFSLISSEQDRQGVIYREVQRYSFNH